MCVQTLALSWAMTAPSSTRTHIFTEGIHHHSFANSDIVLMGITPVVDPFASNHFSQLLNSPSVCSLLTSSQAAYNDRNAIPVCLLVYNDSANPPRVEEAPASRHYTQRVLRIVFNYFLTVLVSF